MAVKSELYLENLSLIERLHRQALEMVKAALDHLDVKDLNSAQALMLFNLGDERLTVGELTHRGLYLGPNVSYNLKKLCQLGYVDQEVCRRDRRRFWVRATDQGLHLYRNLEAVFIAQAASAQSPSEDDLGAANQTCRRMLSFMSHQTDALSRDRQAA